MEIHISKFGVDAKIKETVTRKQPKKSREFLFADKELHNQFLLPSISNLSGIKFSELVNGIFGEFSQDLTYEQLKKKCLEDGHLDEKFSSVHMTDGVFSFFISEKGAWKVKILDYGKYDLAIKQITKVMKYLTRKGAFDSSFGGTFHIQDGDKVISYHLTFLPKGADIYPAHHTRFNEISCYDKETSPEGDLFIFKYEEPVLIGFDHFSLEANSKFGDLFELKLKEFERMGGALPIYICKWTKGDESYVRIAVWVVTGDHDGFSPDWFWPLSMVFTAPTLDKALDELKQKIEDRGIHIIDFDKFKQSVVEAEKKALKNE